VRSILEGDEYNHRLLKRSDYAGNTAVHLAAVGPDPRILRELLERGASVHARNLADHTPLYLAEKAGRTECVALLKEAGAHLWLDYDLKREGSRMPSPGRSGTNSPPGGVEVRVSMAGNGNEKNGVVVPINEGNNGVVVSGGDGGEEG
jgi:lysophospholipase